MLAGPVPANQVALAFSTFCNRLGRLDINQQQALDTTVATPLSMEPPSCYFNTGYCARPLLDRTGAALLAIPSWHAGFCRIARNVHTGG